MGQLVTLEDNISPRTNCRCGGRCGGRCGCKNRSSIPIINNNINIGNQSRSNYQPTPVIPAQVTPAQVTTPIVTPQGQERNEIYNYNQRSYESNQAPLPTPAPIPVPVQKQRIVPVPITQRRVIRSTTRKVVKKSPVGRKLFVLPKKYVNRNIRAEFT